MTARPNRKRRPLPRPTLVPLCRRTPGIRRRLRAYEESLSAAERPAWEAMQRAVRAREDRERPYRLAHLGRRLNACHWAGWDQSRDVGRWTRPVTEHGMQGPKWLGGRR